MWILWGIHWKIRFLAGFPKNQYIRGNCLKRGGGAWTVSRFEVGGGGLGKKGGCFWGGEVVDTLMYTTKHDREIWDMTKSESEIWPYVDFCGFLCPWNVDKIFRFCSCYGFWRSINLELNVLCVSWGKNCQFFREFCVHTKWNIPNTFQQILIYLLRKISQNNPVVKSNKQKSNRIQLNQ